MQMPAGRDHSDPLVIVRSQRAYLTAVQRRNLGFPPDVIAKVERAAGAEAEPFFISVLEHSENLKGGTGFEEKRLVGFSVHTAKADRLIASFRRGLRIRGFLIFRSRNQYGNLPDVVTVVRGTSSYDLLKLQQTEAPSYHLSTKKIIAWLKARQREGPFVITGAGQYWVEARFVRPPQDRLSFARQIASFAPDVLVRGPHTVQGLAKRMQEENGFRLLWE